ncbi:MAG: response regulator [Nitrosomonas sp.]|uniref:response regulator n=1 Tax=Nitrosomonas sp. TaxID=42353 RepID=UPI002733DB75|nr:response regulator [Nitrosomonas sp.]MDP1934145.1 response regulator [Nitrosomonas sp.]MDP3281812.1 response regulator [Nitrosomonas sp.]MDP3662270.1 response regulator [Nitrosomonas sp.]MDZ4105825.1 response regulator [Nitrosomonas sp.]
MHYKNNTHPSVILMIDDNPTDVLLIKEAFAFCEADSEIHVAEDGVYALEFLKRQGQDLHAPRPDLILLDLNMPRRNGFEVLAELKADPELNTIPVIIYTSSVTKEDIRAAYNSHANGYIRKSVDFDECIKTAQSIKDFWFSTAILYEP